MRRHERRLRKAIARERIALLLELARRMWKEDKALAKRYVALAFSIQKRMKVRLPSELKVAFCKKCLIPWLPSETVSISFDRPNKRVLYTCKGCGWQRSFGYRRPKNPSSE